MDLRQIEYILKIAETKNVSKAAKELFITQSALNQQLLKLEKELETPLFYRDRNRWELTSAGKIYTDGAKEILQIKKNTYNRIADQKEISGRSFSLGIPAGRGIRMFTSIYPKFMQLCPNISISPIEMNSYTQQELLEAGRLDLGFLTIGEGKKNTLRYEHVCGEEFLAAVPADYPVVEQIQREAGENGGELDIGLLREESFVLMYPQSSSRTVTDHIFEKAGFTPKVLFETSNTASIPAFVSAGLCCAVIPQYYCSGYDNIRLFRLTSHPSWEMTFCYSKQAYLNHPFRIFIRLAKEYWENYNRQCLKIKQAAEAQED